jgi:hypothetical protein
MDARRSFYLASRQNDYDSPSAEADWVDSNDIPCVLPANDNKATKDCLSTRCAALLRTFAVWLRLAALGKIRTPKRPATSRRPPLMHTFSLTDGEASSRGRGL